MYKTINWFIRIILILVIGGFIFAYLNIHRKPSLIISKPSIEDFKYKELNKKLTNAKFAAKRDYIDYEKYGSAIFCRSSFNSWIESLNYSKQMDFYIFGNNADISKWDNAIEYYENESSQCRDIYP